MILVAIFFTSFASQEKRLIPSRGNVLDRGLPWLSTASCTLLIFAQAIDGETSKTSIVYSFTKLGREEDCVMFWNHESLQKHAKYIKNLIAICTAGDNCVLVSKSTITDDFLLILCDSMGTLINSTCVKVIHNISSSLISSNMYLRYLIGKSTFHCNDGAIHGCSIANMRIFVEC